MARRVRLLAAAALLVAGAAGCGSGVLAADEAATKAEDALEEEIGTRPDISCPDDVEAKVGAETRCLLTAGDDPTEYGVTITVTSVDGDTVNFDVQVDEEPTGGGQ